MQNIRLIPTEMVNVLAGYYYKSQELFYEGQIFQNEANLPW